MSKAQSQNLELFSFNRSGVKSQTVDSRYDISIEHNVASDTWNGLEWISKVSFNFQVTQPRDFQSPTLIGWHLGCIVEPQMGKLNIRLVQVSMQVTKRKFVLSVGYIEQITQPNLVMPEAFSIPLFWTTNMIYCLFVLWERFYHKECSNVESAKTQFCFYHS